MIQPVAPPMILPDSMWSSMTLKVSGWRIESASQKQNISPSAMAAPPLRTAPIMRFSTVATLYPRACARAAVLSVETLSATMTSMASGAPR